jgi:sensor c-di-GMP phosphodiesterase-like protein
MIPPAAARLPAGRGCPYNPGAVAQGAPRSRARWRRVRRLAGFGLLAGAVALLPLAAALLLSYRAALLSAQALLDASAQAVTLRVRDVLLRAEQMVGDARFEAREGCGAELVTALRNAVALASEMRGMAFVTREALLACTSWGLLEPPVAAGDLQIAAGTEADLALSTPAATPYLPGRSMVAVHRLASGDRLLVLFDPAILLNRVDPGDLGPGGYATVIVGGRPVATVGAASGDEGGGPRLLAVQDVGVQDARVEVARSRAVALAGWRQQALVAGLLGLGVSGALVLLVVRLARQRLSLAHEMAAALRSEEFLVHYQPVVDIQHNRCVGAEALIRWQRPDEGMVRPDVFIPVAETSGLIVPLTRWLMAQVVAELGEALRADPALHVGINLAGAHLKDESVIADVQQVFEAAGVPLDRLLVEVTEREMVESGLPERITRELRRLGVASAIDDFGTGYSSLAVLEKLSLTHLKIDRAFVQAINTQSATSGLTAVIIDMARSLHLKIIAEGVETPDQLAYLRERGVEYVQGWVFARAMPAAEFLAFRTRFNQAGAGGGP